jgi:hypothetical protein
MPRARRHREREAGEEPEGPEAPSGPARHEVRIPRERTRAAAASGSGARVGPRVLTGVAGS